MSTTSEPVILADFREKTAEQRRYEAEGFHEILDYLPIYSLEYEDRVFIVEYDFTRHPALARRIKQNPARGLRLFGVISDMSIEDLVITMNGPDKTTLLKVKTDDSSRDIVAVTFRTQTKNLGRRIFLDEATIAALRYDDSIVYTFR